jgi:RND family efflux transporter MFP subunit
MSEHSHSAIGITSLEGDAALDHGELLKRRQIVRRTRIAAAVVLVLLVLGAGRTVLWRMANARTLENNTTEASRQYVKVTLPKTGGGGQTVALPGTLQGFVQAPISARASGYLRRWTKDIGSRVEKGELLAEIDTPEIDQQLTQGLAARDQAAASLDLARSTVARWEALRKKDVVSQQELEERRSAVVQSQANLAAADANVQRLNQLEGFKRVLAPFAGVITRRNVDVGDLIDGGGGSGGRPLFLLSQTDPLRVYVNVPQSYSQLVKPGMAVVVTQAELRGQKFPGQVARTAASIDAATRTMQVEVALANPNGVLLPGAYVQVALPLGQSQALTVSTDTLLFRGEGTQVAVLDSSGRVHLRSVTLGRNFGQTVEVLDGLSASDRLVQNPSDSLAEGDTLSVAPAAAASTPAAKGAP